MQETQNAFQRRFKLLLNHQWNVTEAKMYPMTIPVELVFSFMSYSLEWNIYLVLF